MMWWMMRLSRGLLIDKSMNVLMGLTMWPVKEVKWSLGMLTETPMGVVTVVPPQAALLICSDAKWHQPA